MCCRWDRKLLQTDDTGALQHTRAMHCVQQRHMVVWVLAPSESNNTLLAA